MADVKEYKVYKNTQFEILTDEGFKDFKGLIVGNNNDRVKLTFTDGISLICTPKHKLMIDTKDFVYAKDSSIGDIVYGNKEIKEVEEYSSEDLVYEILDVKDIHRYYVNGVLSHQCLIIDEMAFIPEHIIQEIGDLENISAYTNIQQSYNDQHRAFIYTFQDENNASIQIAFQHLNRERVMAGLADDRLSSITGGIDIEHPFFELLKNYETYNIGFVVNDSEDVGIKSDPKHLFKIINTIKTIVWDFVGKGVKVFVFGTASDKKFRIFTKVIEEQLKSLSGWKTLQIGQMQFIYNQDIEKNI